MRRVLDAFSITQKLGAAFGAMLLVVLAVSLTGLRSASQSEHDVRRVAEQIQPAVLAVTSPATIV